MYNFQKSKIATGATIISVFFSVQIHKCTYIFIFLLLNSITHLKLLVPFILDASFFSPLTLLQHSLWSVVVVIVQYLSLYTNEKFSSELFATRPRVANNGGDHPDRKKENEKSEA